MNYPSWTALWNDVRRTAEPHFRAGYLLALFVDEGLIDGLSRGGGMWPRGAYDGDHRVEPANDNFIIWATP